MARPPPQPPEADHLVAALERYAAQLPRRTGRLADTVLLLLVVGLVALSFDSEGLLAWARRQDVGPGQRVLLSALVPLHGALARVGLDAPRRWAADARESLTRAAGGGGDPLLAEGWVPVLEEEPLTTPLPEPLEDPLEDPPEDAAGAPAPLGRAEGGVVLLGDSMMAGSLGAALERALGRGQGLWVARATQLGTGLARPDIYDWMKVVPPLLERERPRYVVVALGGNDATNLREGEAQLDFGEARWRTVYSARVEAMMRALAGTDTRVLWLALPPMRDRRFSSRAAWLNGIFKQAARRVPRVEVLDLDLLLGAGDRQYATFVVAPDGRLVRYRLDDGVHLAPAGARVVSGWVVDWLKERR